MVFPGLLIGFAIDEEVLNMGLYGVHRASGLWGLGRLRVSGLGCQGFEASGLSNVLGLGLSSLGLHKP